MIRSVVFAAAALLALPSAAPAAPAARSAPAARPAPSPAARDWTRVQSRTPAGAFVMGNPAARVKLVEYLSFTCSHCAHFAASGLPALKRDYIARGLVSLEVRHAIRDGYDLAASLLARCDGPARYFSHADALFAAQDDWLRRAAAAPPPAVQPTAATIGAAMPGFATAAGLDTLMQRRGLAPARIRACLSDKAALDRLSAMTDEAWKVRRLSGTPAFLVNGTIAADTFDWAALEPQIRAALR